MLAERLIARHPTPAVIECVIQGGLCQPNPRGREQPSTFRPSSRQQPCEIKRFRTMDSHVRLVVIQEAGDSIHRQGAEPIDAGWFDPVRQRIRGREEANGAAGFRVWIRSPSQADGGIRLSQRDNLAGESLEFASGHIKTALMAAGIARSASAKDRRTCSDMNKEPAR